MEQGNSIIGVPFLYLKKTTLFNIAFCVEKSILIFQQPSYDYEGEKKTSTHFLLLFSNGMGQKKALPAFMHGRILSPI
ncbi:MULTISPECIES: hypothetical protein [Bacillus]|uniref:hypothetical protein n=1 Tax=Bacillus TaxID=1386 RepID=UPI0005341D30|nr:hypothetical protein [Bacillus pseudomycoides]OOR51333.1 hypothetical protein BLX05_14400 [Bacillus pseudomycoides]PDY10165.1 hypothetical protein COO16_22675 [Bacillus pseudomycoides]PEF76127.1 hypothetical protein CON94_07045 [Bacillus pseudomycoides]PEI45528.1 hypothetical protein CN641_14680 [Bacillus pseudomycoides]PEJ38359.1 hypothetical protein CN677_08340 [Bacillus pseudomycoides]